MPVLEVNRTLIIGLGGTGAQICDQVVRQLQQTFGSVDRVPWVRFMAVDTDGNVSTLLRQQGDFFPIGLDTRTYSQLTDPTQAYSKLNLSTWTDPNTLRQSTETEHGTGNVRMLGRLSFMAPQSFYSVKQGLLERLSALRWLDQDQAQKRLSAYPDGSGLSVRLRDAGAYGESRVLVVGSLCGGTGGGLAPEFVYLLQTMLRSEVTLAFFTLPHPQLPTAISPQSERLKKNAFHALIELNHSSYGDPPAIPSLSYPDGTSANLRQGSYTLPYLVAPNAPTSEAITELTVMVADRVYADLICPESDPFPRLLATRMQERDEQHQAHVFCTFGQASIEVPAAQIIESCAAKLLAETLERWMQVEPVDDPDLSAALGLERSALTAALLQQLPEAWEANITRAVREATAAPRPDLEVLNREVPALHHFLGSGGEWQGHVMARGEQVFDSFFLAFQAHAGEVLLDHTRGPRVLAAEVDRLLADLILLTETVEAQASAGQEAAHTAWQAVVDAADQFREALNRRHLLRSNHAGIRQTGTNLQATIQIYVQFQLAIGIQAAFRTHPSPDSGKSGLADRFQRVLTETRANLRALERRITALKARLDEQHRRSADERPPITGLMVFEPQTTVQDEYRRALTEAGQPGKALESVEKRLQREIIGSWGDLLTAVVLPPQPSAISWLQSRWSSDDTSVIPDHDFGRLWSSATRPFQGLWQQNVVERVPASFPDWANRTRSVAAKAIPALSGNWTREFFPVTRNVVWGPVTAPELTSMFTQRVGGVFAAADRVRWTSPDQTRLTFLQEVIRVPLRAFDQILGEGGLHSAVCEDVPTFYTRKDVPWFSLTSPGTTEPVNEAGLPRSPGLPPESIAPVPAEQAQAALLTYLETSWGSLEIFRSTFVPTWRNAMSLPLEVRWGLHYAGLLDHDAIFGKAPEAVLNVADAVTALPLEPDSGPIPVRQARAALILMLEARGESLEQFRTSIERGDVDLMALPLDARWGLKYAGLLNQRIQRRP